MSGTDPAPGGLVLDRYRVAEGCLDCAGDVAGLLGELPGARQVSVLGAAGIVVIGHDGRVTPEQVSQRAGRLGITLGIADRPAGAPRGPSRWWRSPRLLLLTAAEMLLLAGLATDYLARQHTTATALYLATVATGGIFPVRSAWQVLARRRLSIGTLLVAGTIGALALGAVAEAAMLVVVFSLGGLLEDYVADRARGSIRALMSLTPPVAARLCANGTAQVPVEALEPGERVLVRPGERLPTDGQVTEGSSWIDQSPVTGESIPAEATPGSQVFGGTLNGPGALTIQVTRPYQDTVLARVITQVEQAQASRGTAQRFADRFGAIYTPVMFTLAALMAIIGPFAGLGVHEAVYRALVILVVSCSCALVISVPTAVVAAVSRGARDGILIKGGIHLETLARVRTVAFDKTGTLTAGQPRLTDLVAIDGHPPGRVLALAAAVEAASEHPLAAAVLAAAAERGLPLAPATSTRAQPGTGVHATVDGHQVFVGRPDAAITRPPSFSSQLAALQQAGKTAVLVTVDDRPAALLGIADQLRPEAAATVTALRALGVSNIVMLTGDNPATAAAIARAAGITQWRAGLLPEHKTTAIAALREPAEAVAMVGDGINDAPALATADVGIAMGAAGTDVALETADIALMVDDLDKLPAAVTLARRAATIIRQNIALSLATIAALDTAALTGHMSLAAGLILNEGSALLIIANGLRLLRSPAPGSWNQGPYRCSHEASTPEFARDHSESDSNFGSVS